ncbi:Disulfide bond formation protein B [Roseomonas mucosa]|uniref:disulfide bond formation protein B n=1 Tax=Roseomonas mucosa TaxID=207340 RepID=UPI00220485CC|nr:disulfide bond formation protein B [Roseomonas mucosa]QDJ09507.1 Disulfide bond formation protein B [Roseomonas mucosa]
MIRRSSLSLAVLAAAAPLAALASETFLGLAPCALCLWQRWPYWVAVLLALLAGLLRSRGLLVLAALAVLVSGGLAVLHIGVEQQWWPSPLPSCQAPTASLGLSVDDMLKAMAAKPDKPCDAPTCLIPGLPVTMAQLNLLYALLLGGFGLREALRRRA